MNTMNIIWAVLGLFVIIAVINDLTDKDGLGFKTHFGMILAWGVVIYLLSLAL